MLNVGHFFLLPRMFDVFSSRFSGRSVDRWPKCTPVLIFPHYCKKLAGYFLRSCSTFRSAILGMARNDEGTRGVSPPCAIARGSPEM